MNHMQRSLGAITPDQMAHANQQVDAIAQRLAQQVGIIRQAETAGFDRGLIAQLRSTHAGLMLQLESLTDVAPSLSTTAFAEWVARATGLEAQVTQLEATTQAQLPGADRRHTTIVIVSTIGALTLAGGVAALIWYGTRGR